MIGPPPPTLAPATLVLHRRHGGSAFDYAKLLRHGQLYIGERIPARFSAWARLPLGGGDLELAAHPALAVTRVARGAHTLTLIGFMVDPEHPEQSDAEILEALAAIPGFADSPFAPTFRMGGRWLLVVAGPEDTRAFADAGGLRQLFMAPDPRGGGFHFASEPGILAELGGLRPDPEADAFARSPRFLQNQERWWPGDATLFHEVRRVLPNHAVSLRTGRRVRFWPAERLHRRSMDEAADLLVRRVPAMLRGFTRRRSVEISLTAGIDSRVVLAATRDLAPDLRYLTIRQAGMAADHPDLTVARRLADRLGLNHRVLATSAGVREPVRAAYRDGVFGYHEKWLRDAQAIYDAGGQATAVVTGSTGEALRLAYRTKGVHHSRIRPGPGRLARAGGFGSDPFALSRIRAWLGTVDDWHGYDRGDLFYTEQRTARWLACSQLEFGQVWGEIFAPLNTRELASVVQAVPKAQREEPGSLLFREVVRRLWPEALEEPINPHSRYGRRLPGRRLAGRVRRAVARLVG